MGRGGGRPGPSVPGTGASTSAPWGALLGVALAAVVVGVGLTTDDPGREQALAGDVVVPVTGAPTTGPTTTRPPTTTATSPPVRLVPEVPIPDATGPYVFLTVEGDGDPVTWDPCRPIRFVVNDRLAPSGAGDLLAEAVAAVSAATGLVFEDAGPADEPPPGAEGRALRDRARYGEGWSPVLISWTDDAEVPGLREHDGQAWAASVGTGWGEAAYVSGHVEIDAVDAVAMLERGDRDVLVALLMHELGHLVGLDHVDATTEVMTADPGGIVALDWGPGDRHGLALLGRGECLPPG